MFTCRKYSSVFYNFPFKNVYFLLHIARDYVLLPGTKEYLATLKFLEDYVLLSDAKERSATLKFIDNPANYVYT